MSASLYVAVVLVTTTIAYMIVQQILNRRVVKELDQSKFHNGIRKAQVIDIREKVDHDYGHTDGSHSIPMAMFKQRFQGLRKDQPVYLCDANGITSYRTARILKRNRYVDVYVLKGGYKKRTGKIRSKKQFL